MFTILCIDDESDIRSLLVEELQDAGFNTLEAEDGQQGLQIIQQKWPDIVVSDISMPVMNGLELLAEIQINHPEFSNIPFILLTALTDRVNELAGLEGGAADYLTKPVDFDLLLAKIRGCVMQVENNRRTGRAF